MKKIIIGIVLFFNFDITISNHEVTLDIGSEVYAQHQGEIECPNSSGNGTNQGWWNDFTTWIGEVVGDIIDFLGELYNSEIPGSDQYGGSNLYYPWGSNGTLPYVDVYYDGNSYACFETPSIYGGPYRGGRMLNCTDGSKKYIDCAYLEHNTNESGISGTTADIAYLDECNECVGGSTGLPPCSSPLYFTALQNGDTTKYYDGDTITIEKSSYYTFWTSIGLYNEHGVIPPSIGWFPTCNSQYLHGYGSNYTNLNTQTVGDYSIEVREGNILSYATIFTNHLRVVITDTVKPTPIICDTLAIERDSIATSMLNQISTSPELIQMRDSSLGHHELSFSTYDSSGSTRVYPGSLDIGDTLNVDTYPKDTIVGANHKNITSIWHLHHANADPFPDPGDLYNLMLVRTLRGVSGVYGPFSNYNPYLNHSFIVCDTSATDLAIVVYDTALAYNYVHVNPKDSVIKWDTAAKGPIYSPTYKGKPYLNAPKFNISMGDDFKDAYNALKRRRYPERLARTYAGVYMMQRYNMGIKTLMKVNGVFKELKVTFTRNRNGSIRTIIVKICQ